MCGIVGYITIKPQFDDTSRSRFLAEALYMDTLRGWDSTGVMWCKPHGKIRTLKGAMSGPEFLRTKEYNKEDPGGWFAVGHNRAATHGTVKTENAHPFKHGPITLVHNGTVSNWRSLPKTDSTIEVDSSMIAYNLSHVKPDEVDDVLKKVDGSYALVWYDERDKSVNFVKNGGRPLHFALSRNKEILWFMSEADMLRSVCGRLRNTQLAPEQIYELESYKHVKFKKGSLVPVVTSTSPFQRPAYQAYGGTYQSRAHWQGWDGPYHTHRTGTHSDTGRRTGTGDYSPLDSTLRAAAKAPESCKKLMEMQYELTPDMKLEFRPGEYISWGGGFGMVRGTIIHPKWGNTEWDAVMYDFPDKWIQGDVAKDRMKRSWTVSPIGLAPNWYGSTEKTIAALRVAVHLFMWNQPAEEVEGFDDDDEDLPKMSNAEDKFYMGPNNKALFKDQLEALLQYGCQSCNANIPVEDHETIMWVDTSPVCEACASVLTDPEEVVKQRYMH